MIALKPRLSIKTLYRSPVKTLLTFILLALVTFAFFSQTAEYAITAREFNNAAKHYCGVGSAEIAPPEDTKPATPFPMPLDGTGSPLYKPLTREQISALSALPYITSTDMRYMTAGISDTYERLDDGRYFFNFTARCVIEGKLTGVNYGQQLQPNYLQLGDCKLLAGNPPWKVDQKSIKVTDYTIKPKKGDAAALGRDTRSIVIITSDYKYDTEYIQKNMTIGNRYVLVLRYDPLVAQEYDLSDHLSDIWCDAVWPIDGGTSDYLKTEAYAPLRSLIEITNADIHTFDMVYTEDMSSIMRFAKGSMVILNGRGLTKEDSTGGAKVCVISREFAEKNGLAVGNSITMKLGAKLFEQYKNLGAVAATPERYAIPKKTETFQIVGIYADTDGPNAQSKEPNWSYSANTIFVPQTFLPIGGDDLTGHEYTPAEFSFKIENAWDIPAFLKETAPRIKAMGLNLIFYDDGWVDIANGFKATRQLTLIKIVVMSAAIAAATGFVVYLFVGRKKKEYAIMRALGTTNKVAVRALIIPLMAVAGVSVLAGSAAAWIYTTKTIAHSNAFSLLKEYTVSTSVPPFVAVGCILGELLLTLLIALLLLRRIGAMSPLSLLHDNGNKRADRIKGSSKEAAPIETRIPAAVTSAPAVPGLMETGASVEKTALNSTAETARKPRRSGPSSFILRYIGRHIYRSVGKSALVILLAALLFGVIGQLALMKESYTQLCTETVVKTSFVGGLGLGTVPMIVNSGYIKNPYYEARQTVDMNFAQTELVITNNISRYTSQKADITYAPGFDASSLNDLNDIIIVGKSLAETYSLKPGDTVQISPEMYLKKLQQTYIDLYRGAHPREAVTDAEILALNQDAIMKTYNQQAHAFTIAGVISTASGTYDNMAFTPGINETYALFGTLVKLDVAEFTLADNFRTDEFRTYAEKVCAGSTSKITNIMDTSKLENLKNSLRLLEALYPITMAAALLIGGFICCLVIVQSSKEAAIMRIQGTTRRKTNTMLLLEQLFLSIAGLVLGVCGLLVYKGAALSVVSTQLGLFAGLYVAVVLGSAVICAALTTRRNVLQLLQTKE